MSDFDPNDELDSQAQADRYVDWCAENLMRLAAAGPQTFRTAQRCLAWLFVVASAQLHLDEEIETNREALLEQLANYQALGRAIERQRERYNIERLIVLRSSLDCWESSGQWGDALLAAAKCAVAGMLLIETHPLFDLWELLAPDAWALIEVGIESLAQINLAAGVTFEDFSVKPDEMAVAKFTWQRANNLVRRMGLPPLSEN